MSAGVGAGAGVGVISTLPNPTLADVEALAREAERAGADWLGVPDAFWWRDTWLLAAAAARATTTLAIGPVVTNPYLRHPFHTLAAVGTLQELAGPERVLLGLAAGGSEIGVAARVDRRDAPARIVDLVSLLRDVAGGAPLDPESGRTLEVPLRAPRVLVAGRAPKLLAAGGAVADDVLLWSVPRSELASSAAGVAAGGGAGLIWAPLLVDEDLDAAVAAPPGEAGYVVLNSRPETRRAWGVDDALAAEVRRGLVAGERVEGLVPEAALRDVLVSLAARDEARELYGSVGARGIAVAAPTLGAVAPRVAWARDVLAA